MSQVVENTPSRNEKESLKKLLDPNPDADGFQI